MQLDRQLHNGGAGYVTGQVGYWDGTDIKGKCISPWVKHVNSMRVSREITEQAKLIVQIHTDPFYFFH